MEEEKTPQQQYLPFHGLVLNLMVLIYFNGISLTSNKTKRTQSLTRLKDKRSFKEKDNNNKSCLETVLRFLLVILGGHIGTDGGVSVSLGCIILKVILRVHWCWGEDLVKPLVPDVTHPLPLIGAFAEIKDSLTV